jgi:hypothetical protein
MLTDLKGFHGPSYIGRNSPESLAASQAGRTKICFGRIFPAIPQHLPSASTKLVAVFYRILTMLADGVAIGIAAGVCNMSKEQTVSGTMTLSEIKEFASFDAATQRYIRRSLDIAFDRKDAVETWSRDVVECAAIKAQTKVYAKLPSIRAAVPKDCAINNLDAFLVPLIAVSAFDLGQGRLNSFPAYRFLFERLVSAEARPWLPASFCAAAALPHLHPKTRKKLLQSISEAAATAPGWSTRPPSFYPEWVEKVDVSRASH